MPSDWIFTTTDSFAQAILAHIDTSRASYSQSQQPGLDYRQFEYHDGLLFFKKLVYVPDCSCRLQIVQNCHDAHTTGHFGSTKTLDLVQRSFWWPHMRRFVDNTFGPVVGHLCGAYGRKPSPSKVNAIKDMKEECITQTEVQRFLGACAFNHI